MRNLKKVLTLVLTVAMLLSIMVVGTGAAFSDQDSIKNTEAVDVCSTLNIIGGFPDGSYRPTNNVTRAEMCKMICVLLNGGKEPTLGNNTVSTFTDVRGTSGGWAESYIESCNSQGIVSGVGGGRFNPNGSVTGTQAARMLLVAMGFNADNEKFTGTSWDINVNIRATQKGLYNGIETIDTNAALTRDNAAQMIKNALDATMVTYKNEFTTGANGQIVATPVLADKLSTNGKESITLLKDKYGADTDEGILTYNGLSGYTASKGEYTYTVNGTQYTSTTDYTDLYQQNVTVMFKKDANNKVTDVYGIYPEESSVVASGVLGDIDSTSSNEVKINGTTYKLSKAATAVEIYEFLAGGAVKTAASGSTPAVNYTLSDFATYATKANQKLAYNFELIDNTGDGKGDVLVAYPVAVAKLTYVNSSGVRVGATEYKFDENTIYDGAKKDDWVIITANGNTADDKAVIDKADVVSGKVSSVKTGSGSPAPINEVRIDGTWYSSLTGDTTTAINNKVDLVTYNGYYFNVDGSSTSLDVAVVTGIGSYNRMDDTTEVRLIFKDGTEDVIDVEKWGAAEGKDITEGVTAPAAKDVLVSYSIDDDKYTLTTVTNTNAIGSSDYTGIVATEDVSYDKSKAAFVKGPDEYDIAEDAMIVIKNSDNKYTYMSGKDLLSRNDITFGTVYVAVDNKEVGALFATTTASITTGDELYGYIVSSGLAVNDNGKTKLYIDVIIDGEKLTDVETDKTAVGDYIAGTTISYVMNDNVMSIKDKVTTTTASIDDFNDARVLLTNGTRLLLTKDTVIIAIDSANDKDVKYAGNSLMSANAKTFNNDGTVSTYYKNAAYKLNSDGEIEVIIVQVASDKEFN